MLDKRSYKLLDSLLHICGEDGSYKIIEYADIARAVLPRYKIDNENILQIIKFLAAAELVDVKYTDESVVCVAILPKGRIYEEERMARNQNKVMGKGMAFLIIFGSFFAAIIGAIVGGLLGSFMT
ncbi:MAG: hypothetical protein FWE45_04215 [Firmicutes bacterium]|nr:hypothetical protein [Bacillota bacterium]